MFGCTLTPGYAAIAYKAGILCFRCVACCDKRKKGLRNGFLFSYRYGAAQKGCTLRLYLKIIIDAEV